MHQGEIDGGPAGVDAALARVGDEAFVGGGVPEYPLCLDGAVGVEDFQAQAEALGEAVGVQEPCACFGQQEGHRPLVDRLAGEHAVGGVDDVEQEAVGLGYFLKQRQRRCPAHPARASFCRGRAGFRGCR